MHVGSYADAVRLTVFWERMNAQFGAAYAESLCRDLVLSALGGRTPHEALAAEDVDARDVWLAVCDAMGVPVSARH